MLETFKAVLDGLKDHGIIVDDNSKVIGMPKLTIIKSSEYSYDVTVRGLEG